jgi:hypothetical protein
VPVNPSPESERAQISTATPLLRLALMILLVLAVVAGLMVTGGLQTGWLALAFVVVAGPVIVLLDGWLRSRTGTATRHASRAREMPQQLSFSRPRRAA